MTKDQNLSSRLLPRPQQISETGPGLQLGAGSQITYTPRDDAQARWIAERSAQLLSTEFGLALELQPAMEPGWSLSLTPGEALRTQMAAFSSSEPEAYRLSVRPEGATVQAGNARGLLWGAMTLRQLATPRRGTLTFPGVEIADGPRYRWRGFMVDAGRSPCSVAQIKRIIRICSAFKLNLLVYREGDDELNAVRYRTNLLGSCNPHALSTEDVADLIAYAQRFGVDLIPEIESLGHSTAKGFHYPHLVSGGFVHAYDDVISHIRKSHLDPGDPRSYELLASMYDEWFGMMRSPLIHLGLDEVRLSAEEQAAHLARLLPLVDRVAVAHGIQVQPVVWADAPTTPAEYRDRVIRCVWSYANREVSLENEHLLKQELDRLSEPGCTEQVLMAGGSGSRHEPYTKSDTKDAIDNLADWARWGKERENFAGLLAVQWHGNMLDDWLPDFLAAADYGWNPPEGAMDSGNALVNIQGHLGRLRDAAHPRPEEVDRPAWDGIWLRDGAWYEDIMSGRRFRRG